MLHDVGNNRDCDVDVDHRNTTTAVISNHTNATKLIFTHYNFPDIILISVNKCVKQLIIMLRE